MTFAESVVLGVSLELASDRLEYLVDDIERLKALLAELLDDTDIELREGSRFQKLAIVKSLLYAAGLDAYSARRSVKEALRFQQESLPQPEDVA